MIHTILGVYAMKRSISALVSKNDKIIVSGAMKIGESLKRTQMEAIKKDMIVLHYLRR